MSDLTISRVEAIPFAIPYRKPLRFASGEVHTADHVLLRVHTAGGLIGHAEAPPRPYTYGETQASIVAVVDQIFAPALIGLSILDREAHRTRLGRTVGNPTAKAALDMACWDATGQALGQPVHRLLGGYAPAMDVCHMLGFDEPMTIVEEATRMLEQHGISTFKVKVGQEPYRRDVEVVRALREAFGDRVELYVDGNRGWCAADAARAMDEMADLGLTLAEELNPADDVLGRRWLVQRCPIPFVADESATTPPEVTREILGGSATAISLKTARSGFSEGQRVLHLAEGLGVAVVMGNQIDGQVGTLCSLVFGAAHRSTSRRAGELSNFLDMSDDLLTRPLTVTGGRLAVPPGVGLGLEVDEDALSRYRQDR